MIAAEHFGGFVSQVGGPLLRLIPGQRFVRLDCAGGEVVLILPSPADLTPGGEHWRVFVENGTLAYGEVSLQPAGIPVVFGPGLVIVIPPLNAAGDWPLVDNTTAQVVSVPSQVRGSPSPFVVVDGAEQPVNYQAASLNEKGAATSGQWLSVSYGGLVEGTHRWVFQTGDWLEVAARDTSTGLVVSHGSDAAAAPSSSAWRLDLGLGTWRTLPAATTPRTEAAGFAVPTFGQDTHYMVGGFGPLASAEKYLLDTWGFVPSSPSPTTGAASWDALASGFLHGGVSLGGQLFEFIAAAGLGAWATRSTSFQARLSHTGGRLGGAPSPFAWLSGGGATQDGSLVQRYQAGLDAWGLAPRRPSGTVIAPASAGYVSDREVPARLWVGGRYQWMGTDLADISRQVWELSASPVEAWRAMPQPAAPVINAAAAGVRAPGELGVAGGGSGNPSALTLSLRALDVWRVEASMPAARTGLRAHGTAGRAQA